MNRWIAGALAGSAALSLLVLSLAARSRESDGAWTTRPIAWTETAAECNFDRIAIAPGGDAFLLWLDRRPLFRGYGAYHTRSTIALVEAHESVRFLSLAGEVSALNWAGDDRTAEFLIDGRDHVVLRAGDSELRHRRAADAWRVIGIKNLRWGGLSAVMADRGFTGTMPLQRSEIRRRMGFVLAAEHNEYHPLAPERGAVPAKVLDHFYVEQLYAGGDSHGSVGNGVLPRRPVFDVQTGRLSGSYDMLDAYDADGRRVPVADRVPGSFLRDRATLGRTRASLLALPGGGHWLAVEGPGGARSRQICGPRANGYRGSLVVIASEGIEYPAFHHRAAGGDHLVVRFHGGPYSSVLDDFPSEAARRVGKTGGSILEVSYPGARVRIPAPAPRVTPRVLRSFSEALADWIARAGYRSVTVMGVSFGAVGAVDYALADAERVRALVLMAPLTRFDPQRSLTGRPLAEGTLQWDGEAVILGDAAGRREFARWLEESVATACRTLRLAVVVGARDTQTPSGGQAGCVKDRMTIVPGADHSSLIGRDEAWNWLNPASAGTAHVRRPAI